MDWFESLITNSDLVERDLGDEIIVMSQDGQFIHSFEDTAFWIWKRIKDGITPTKILNEMISMYDVKEHVAKNDLIFFIEDLQQKGVLK
jgi:Coenzyme PQQ synthesis protein D (PqqD)